MSLHATFRFYEELNDFLPRSLRKRPTQFRFYNPVPVKGAIESFGIPHTEVDLILANSVSVNFDFKLQTGDYISVFPKFESFDITGLSLLRSKPLRCPRFILDVHLGKLARLLRLLGQDCAYRNDYEDHVIVQTARAEQRIILTRDRGILKTGQVDRGYWIRAADPILQAREVVRRFDLRRQLKPFSLCLECNHTLRKVDKELIDQRISERTRRYYDIFYLCDGCDRIYWEGSHFHKLKIALDSVTR